MPVNITALNEHEATLLRHQFGARWGARPVLRVTYTDGTVEELEFGPRSTVSLTGVGRNSDGAATSVASQTWQLLDAVSVSLEPGSVAVAS